MQLETFGNRDGSNVMFLCELERYHSEEMADICEANKDYDLLVAVTNGGQTDIEEMMAVDGWEQIATGDKNLHVRQRELGSSYIRMWVLNPKTFEANFSEVQALRLKSLKDKPGYEFLNEPAEFFSHLNENIAGTHFRALLQSLIDKGKVSEMSDYYMWWPFYFQYACEWTQEHADNIRTFHMEAFKFIIPKCDPFTGRQFEKVRQLQTFFNRLKRGDHVEMLKGLETADVS